MVGLTTIGHIKNQIERACASSDIRPMLEQVLDDLTGRSMMWLPACREAAFCESGGEEEVGAYLLGMPLEIIKDFSSDKTEEWISKRKALAIWDCALAAIALRRPAEEADPREGAQDQANRVLKAIGAWQELAGASSDFSGNPTTHLKKVLRFFDPPEARLEAMVTQLHSTGLTWQLGPVRDLIRYFLGDDIENAPWTRSVETTVLMVLNNDKGESGGSAGLRLEIREGHGEFYPNPLKMAFCATPDRGFQEQLQTAWGYVALQDWYEPRADVRWSLTPTIPGVSFARTRLEGGSAGAAFAMALSKLFQTADQG